ncbi:Protein of unknown function DUF262 [Rhodococcus qingshengii]|nr:Protein of unknown function DUF262 [Rhodococcus qingshengii]
MALEAAEHGLRVHIFPGEQIEVPKPDIFRAPTDQELNARYVKEGVRIVTEQARYPLNQIQAMFSGTFQTDEGETEHIYKRDPEYQRRHRWDDGRKSRLIESFLMNVPVPPVFLYENELARYEVMDGRQRLTALMDFYEDNLILTDLQYWKDLEGRTYSKLPSSIKNGIDRRYLSSIILLNETGASEGQAAVLKKLVFERLNSGGVRLSGQETRNAVYNGPLNDLCMELSQTFELRAVLGTPDQQMAIPSYDEDSGGDLIEPTEGGDVQISTLGRKMFESMEDVELVLRFFAYRHLDQFPQGLNRVTEFLDEFLSKANEFDAETLGYYKTLFLANISFWYKVSGKDAFQVNSRRHFSKVAYDALMYASSAISDQQRSLLLEDPSTLHETVRRMFVDHAEVFGGRKTNAVDARSRNTHALEALAEALEQAQGRS